MCQAVCLENVLWQNGGLDPDAIWGDELGRSMDGCIRRGPHAPRGRGSFWGEKGCPHWFLQRICLTEMYLTCA